MADYLDYMKQISSASASRSKLQYLNYNFSKYLRPNLRILEIGPGLGEFLEFASSSFSPTIDLIDRDQATLSALKSKYRINRDWQVPAEEIGAIDAELGQYDLIFMSQIMEHVETKSIVGLLKTLDRHLRPGGHLLVTVPNGANPLSIVERYSDYTHHNLFSPNSLKQIVQFADLANVQVHIEGYKIPADNILGFIRNFLQAVLHFVLKLILIINGGVYFSPLHPNITLVIKKLA